MTNNTGLYLCFLEDAPTWEEECPVCKGKGKTKVDKSAYTDRRTYCPCRGTGTRTVRLAGRVATNIILPPTEEMKKSISRFGLRSYIEIKGEMKAAEVITELYRSNTLPSSLLQSPDNPDGLHTVEVEG